MGKEELIALLCLSSWCLMIVIIVWLFLTMSWIGLQCVIVVFPDHTHFLFILYGCLLYIKFGATIKITGRCRPTSFCFIKNLKKVLEYEWTINGYKMKQKENDTLNDFLKKINRQRTEGGILAGRYANLSHDVASGSDITPCNKIDKPFLLYTK